MGLQVLVVEPSKEVCEQTKARMAEEAEKQQLLQQMKGQETVTKDGRQVHLYANIGSVSDIASVLDNDAEGIGLFRSEFLYMESGTKPPTEEQQFQVFRLAAEAMGEKRVVIRTADLGGDKQVNCLDLNGDPIRLWDIGESVSCWRRMKFSALTCGRFCGHPCMVILQ